MKKFVRKVTRTGGRSMCVVIPSEIVDNLKLREKQKLEIYQSGERIIIKDWKKK